MLFSGSLVLTVTAFVAMEVKLVQKKPKKNNLKIASPERSGIGGHGWLSANSVGICRKVAGIGERRFRLIRGINGWRTDTLRSRLHTRGWTSTCRNKVEVKG